MRLTMNCIMLVLCATAEFSHASKNNTYLTQQIKPYTYTSDYITREANYLLGNTLDKSAPGKSCSTTKRVVYIYPNRKGTAYANTLHNISPEDMLIYQQNNIVVSKISCSLIPKDSLKKLKPRFYWWSIFLGHDTIGYKAFLLCSKNLKEIELYAIKKFMCDGIFFATTHQGIIAILIDEADRIISILDNVKEEKEIFIEFGIKI